MHGFAPAEASGSGGTVTEHQEPSTRKRRDTPRHASASLGASTSKKDSKIALRWSNSSRLRVARVFVSIRNSYALRRFIAEL